MSKRVKSDYDLWEETKQPDYQGDKMPSPKDVKPDGPNVFVPAHSVPSFDELLPEAPDGLACVSNDQISEGEGQLRYQKALERGSIPTEAVMKIAFSARWFYVFRVQSRDDEGETKGEHLRVVFMSKAGDTYETHSETAERTVRGWIALRGWLAWEPPVEFMIQKKKGAKGRTYHQLTTNLTSGPPPEPPKD